VISGTCHAGTARLGLNRKVRLRGNPENRTECPQGWRGSGEEARVVGGSRQPAAQSVGPAVTLDWQAAGRVGERAGGLTLGTKCWGLIGRRAGTCPARANGPNP